VSEHNIPNLESRIEACEEVIGQLLLLLVHRIGTKNGQEMWSEILRGRGVDL
jgi:hypothetical protein